MATPYTADYGTVSGQSTGFRGGPVRDDVEFRTLQDRVGAAVQEMKQQTHTLRQLYQQIGTSSDSERVRGRIRTILQRNVEKFQGTKADLQQLMQIGQSSGNTGQRLAAKSLHQQVQKSGNDFNALSQNILERLQEYRESPRSQGSLSHGFLDSRELNDSAHLPHSPRQSNDLLLHFLTQLEDSTGLLQLTRQLDSPADSYRHAQQQQKIKLSSEARLAEEKAYAEYMVKEDIGQLNELVGRIAQVMPEQGHPSSTAETQEAVHSNVHHGNVQHDNKRSCCCICC